MNHKQLLMDFYLKLLAISPTDRFRATNQKLYAEVRDIIAYELDEDGEVIQRIFETMVAEDAKL